MFDDILQAKQKQHRKGENCDYPYNIVGLKVFRFGTRENLLYHVAKQKVSNIKAYRTEIVWSREVLAKVTHHRKSAHKNEGHQKDEEGVKIVGEFPFSGFLVRNQNLMVQKERKEKCNRYQDFGKIPRMFRPIRLKIVEIGLENVG